jgi:hypothetical protein
MIIVLAVFAALGVSGFCYWLFEVQSEAYYPGDTIMSGTVVDAGKVDPNLLTPAQPNSH